MKEKRTELNYFIGDPGGSYRLGQDEHGQVHCLVWGIVYRKEQGKHPVAIGGGGIGHAESIPEARKMIHDYAKADLARRIVTANSLIRRCKAALDKLGDDPANVERFIGDYNEGN